MYRTVSSSIINIAFQLAVEAGLTKEQFIEFGYQYLYQKNKDILAHYGYHTYDDFRKAWEKKDRRIWNLPLEGWDRFVGKKSPGNTMKTPFESGPVMTESPQVHPKPSFQAIK